MRKFLLKYLVGGVLIMGAITAQAQQDPYYSHFKFVKQAYNPAAVGDKDDYICASALAHNQWIGFDDQTWMDRTTGEPIQGGQITENVAPVTFNFNIGGQILGGKDRPTPLGGIGVSVFDDRIGFMKTTAFKFQGAYFVPIQGKFGRLSVGFEAGFTQFGYVNPQFRFRDPNDPRIPTSSISDSKFDFGFGAYYTQKRLTASIRDFYVGASMSHINAATYTLSNGIPPDQPYQLARHIFVNTGANIPLGSGVNVLEPAILVKYNSKPQIDLNLTILNNETIRGGIGYRQWGTIDAITVLLGYVTGQMQFGYSYDITTSQIQSVSNGTHEIFASYCFRLPTTQPPVKTYKKSVREL
ncbi:MAG: type IX secretion system membrane protein PorP/SprF [Bacteroidia bacterium]|nr:type IX secretion system membrane protein PorP/SprF [Bacteroidia bacterium]